MPPWRATRSSARPTGEHAVLCAAAPAVRPLQGLNSWWGGSEMEALEAAQIGTAEAVP